MTHHPPGSLSIIMPAFNEDKNLVTAVTVTRDTLEAHGIPFEIIVVDDGSRDTTVATARDLAKTQPHLAVICHERNQGIGAAFWTGVQKASLDYVILVPCDNPLMPDDLATFLPHMGTTDIIAGARKERTGYTPGLKFMSWFYNRVLIGALFQIPLSDVNWIQMYRRKIFTEGGITIEHAGIFFFAEVLVKARRQGYTMTEVPVTMRKRIHGKPTISRLPVIMKIFRDTVKFFFTIHVSK